MAAYRRQNETAYGITRGRISFAYAPAMDKPQIKPATLRNRCRLRCALRKTVPLRWDHSVNED
jgi:hypothetical protein